MWSLLQSLPDDLIFLLCIGVCTGFGFPFWGVTTCPFLRFGIPFGGDLKFGLLLGAIHFWGANADGGVAFREANADFKVGLLIDCRGIPFWGATTAAFIFLRSGYILGTSFLGTEDSGNLFLSETSVLTFTTLGTSAALGGSDMPEIFACTQVQMDNI